MASVIDTISELLSSKDALTSIVERTLRDDNSVIHSIIENQLNTIQSNLTKAQSARTTYTTSGYVPSAAMQTLERLWPHIDFIVGRGPPLVHPVAGISRILAQQQLVRDIPPDEPFIDVGSNLFSLFKEHPQRAHGCAPVLGLRDSQRRQTEFNKFLSSVQTAKTPEALEEVMRTVDAWNNHCCHQPTQTCSFQARYGYALHATYDWDNADHIACLEAHGFDEFTTVINYHESMMFRNSGVIPDLGISFRVIENGTSAHRSLIDAGYSGDHDLIEFYATGETGTFSYIHNLDRLRDVLSTVALKTKRGRYIVERRIVGGQLFSRYVYAPGLNLGNEILMQRFWFGPPTLVACYSYSYRDNPHSSERMDVVEHIDYVDGDLIARVSTYARGLTDSNFTYGNILTYFRSSNERWTTNGSDISSWTRAPAEAVPRICQSIFVECFQQRYATSRATADMINTILARRGVRNWGGVHALWFILRGYFNVEDLATRPVETYFHDDNGGKVVPSHVTHATPLGLVERYNPAAALRRCAWNRFFKNATCLARTELFEPCNVVATVVRKSDDVAYIPKFTRANAEAAYKSLRLANKAAAIAELRTAIHARMETYDPESEMFRALRSADSGCARAALKLFSGEHTEVPAVASLEPVMTEVRNVYPLGPGSAAVNDLIADRVPSDDVVSSGPVIGRVESCPVAQEWKSVRWNSDGPYYHAMRLRKSHVLASITMDYSTHRTGVDTNNQVGVKIEDMSPTALLARYPTLRAVDITKGSRSQVFQSIVDILLYGPSHTSVSRAIASRVAQVVSSNVQRYVSAVTEWAQASTIAEAPFDDVCEVYHEAARSAASCAQVLSSHTTDVDTARTIHALAVLCAHGLGYRTFSSDIARRLIGSSGMHALRSERIVVDGISQAYLFARSWPSFPVSDVVKRLNDNLGAALPRQRYIVYVPNFSSKPVPIWVTGDRHRTTLPYAAMRKLLSIHRARRETIFQDESVDNKALRMTYAMAADTFSFCERSYRFKNNNMDVPAIPRTEDRIPTAVERLVTGNTLIFDAVLVDQAFGSRQVEQPERGFFASRKRQRTWVSTTTRMDLRPMLTQRRSYGKLCPVVNDSAICELTGEQVSVTMEFVGRDLISAIRNQLPLSGRNTHHRSHTTVHVQAELTGRSNVVNARVRDAFPTLSPFYVLPRRPLQRATVTNSGFFSWRKYRGVLKSELPPVGTYLRVDADQPVGHFAVASDGGKASRIVSPDPRCISTISVVRFYDQGFSVFELQVGSFDPTFKQQVVYDGTRSGLSVFTLGHVLLPGTFVVPPTPPNSRIATPCPSPVVTAVSTSSPQDLVVPPVPTVISPVVAVFASLPASPCLSQRSSEVAATVVTEPALVRVAASPTLAPYIRPSSPVEPPLESLFVTPCLDDTAIAQQSPTLPPYYEVIEALDLGSPSSALSPPILISPRVTPVADQLSTTLEDTDVPPLVLEPVDVDDGDLVGEQVEVDSMVTRTASVARADLPAHESFVTAERIYRSKDDEYWNDVHARIANDEVDPVRFMVEPPEPPSVIERISNTVIRSLSRPVTLGRKSYNTAPPRITNLIGTCYINATVQLLLRSSFRNYNLNHVCRRPPFIDEHNHDLGTSCALSVFLDSVRDNEDRHVLDFTCVDATRNALTKRNINQSGPWVAGRGGTASGIVMALFDSCCRIQPPFEAVTEVTSRTCLRCGVSTVPVTDVTPMFGLPFVDQRPFDCTLTHYLNSRISLQSSKIIIPGCECVTADTPFDQRQARDTTLNTQWRDIPEEFFVRIDVSAECYDSTHITVDNAFYNLDDGNGGVVRVELLGYTYQTGFSSDAMGHVVAYVRLNGRWWLCNDDTVHRVERPAVISQHALLLFRRLDRVEPNIFAAGESILSHVPDSRPTSVRVLRDPDSNAPWNSASSRFKAGIKAIILDSIAVSDLNNNHPTYVVAVANSAAIYADDIIRRFALTHKYDAAQPTLEVALGQVRQWVPKILYVVDGSANLVDPAVACGNVMLARCKPVGLDYADQVADAGYRNDIIRLVRNFVDYQAHQVRAITNNHRHTHYAISSTHVGKRFKKVVRALDGVVYVACSSDLRYPWPREFDELACVFHVRLNKLVVPEAVYAKERPSRLAVVQSRLRSEPLPKPVAFRIVGSEPGDKVLIMPKYVGATCVQIFEAANPILQDMIANPHTIRKRNIHKISGVPGCGKTYEILCTATVDSAAIGNTRHCGDELFDGLRRFVNPASLGTLDGYLVRSNKPFVPALYIDEYTAAHIGAIYLSAHVARARDVYVYGDRLQCGWTNRLQDDADGPRFFNQHVEIPADTEVFRHISHRITKFACFSIAPFYKRTYGVDIVTTNAEIGIPKYRLIQNLSQIQVNDVTKWMTFDQANKLDCLQFNLSNRDRFAGVHTIHESQGSTTKIAGIIALQPKGTSAVFKSEQHFIVGMTRNTHGLYVFSHKKSFPDLDRIQQTSASVEEFKKSSYFRNAQPAGNVRREFGMSYAPKLNLNKDTIYLSRERLQLFDKLRNAHGFDTADISTTLRDTHYTDDFYQPLQSCPANHVHNVHQAIQWALEDVMPGIATLDKSNDSRIIEDAPLDLTAVGVVDFKPAAGKQLKAERTFRPRLQTGLPPNRQQTQRQGFLGMVKRNLMTVDVSGIIDWEHDSQVSVDYILDKLCVPGARKELEFFKNQPVGYFPSEIKKWLMRQETSTVQRLLGDTDLSLFDTDMSELEYILKKDVKPVIGESTFTQIQAGQTVMFSQKRVNALFGPMIEFAIDRLISLLKPNVVYNRKKDMNQLEELFSQVLGRDNDFVWVEDDVSGYDKAQQQMVWHVVRRLLQLLGMWNPRVKDYLESQIATRTYGRDFGLTLFRMYQRNSGMPDTGPFNTISRLCQVAEMLANVPNDDILLVCVLGDDFLGAIRDSKYLRHAFDAAPGLISRVYNLTIKIYRFKSGYFCGFYLVPHDGRYYLFADPYRRAVKLGRYDINREDMFRDLHTSLNDSLRHYDNQVIKELAIPFIAERYKGLPLPSLCHLLDALSYVRHSFVAFRSLWEDELSDLTVV